MLDPVKWREDPLLCECAVCCRLLVCLLSGVTSHPHVPQDFCKTRQLGVEWARRRTGGRRPREKSEVEKMLLL